MPKISRSLAIGRTAVKNSLVSSGFDAPDVWVACSGGADSLALMACTSHVMRRETGTMFVVIVDHNLQDASALVANQAKAECIHYGVPAENIFIETVDVNVSDGGLENAARTSRYEAIEFRAQEVSGDNHVILTGHTMDDQAETVLLALSRGSGAKSIAGIPAQRGRILRPFLSLRRTDSEEICEAEGLSVWNDPTNYVTENGPKRSVLRNAVLPMMVEVLGEGLIPGLARSASMARDDDDVLTKIAQEWLDENPPTVDGGYSCDSLRALPSSVLTRVLKTLAETRAGSVGITSKHVEVLVKYVVDYGGQSGTMLPGAVRVTRKNRHLYFG